MSNLCQEPHPEDPTRRCDISAVVGHGEHWDRAHPEEFWPNVEARERARILKTQKQSKGRGKRKSGMTEIAAAIASNQMQGLTKAEGMALAYDAQIPARDNFERVIYHLARTTPPEQHFSTNEVWAYWRDVLGWAEPEKRQFAGPAMKASATKHGWTTVVGETENTSGNGHAEREKNLTYSSLIYAP